MSHEYSKKSSMSEDHTKTLREVSGKKKDLSENTLKKVQRTNNVDPGLGLHYLRIRMLGEKEIFPEHFGQFLSTVGLFTVRFKMSVFSG